MPPKQPRRRPLQDVSVEHQATSELNHSAHKVRDRDRERERERDTMSSHEPTDRVGPVHTPPAASSHLPELSERDRERLKKWLDLSTMPFTVWTAPCKSRKRKRGGIMDQKKQRRGAQVQEDLFDERLSVQYQVEPQDKWACLKPYRKFTIADESITRNQCVLVKAPDDSGPHIDVAAQWKAKVLEVRALDPDHVYVRVAWLNRPEDLKHGRQPHHGLNELIPTNQMDIIEGATVNGPLEVVKWDEYDDETPFFEDQYYWRQTLDVVTDNKKSRGLSGIREICIDKKPINPDETRIQCTKCSNWQHADCLAKNVVVGIVPSKPKTKKLQPFTKSDASSGHYVDPKTGASAELFVKGEPADDDEVRPADKSEIVFTAPNGSQSTHEPTCLLCAEPLFDD